MALFENGKPEEFLLYVRNLQITLEASGALATSAKIQYLRMLLRGKELRQVDNLCVKVVIIITTHLNCIILGLGT